MVKSAVYGSIETIGAMIRPDDWMQRLLILENMQQSARKTLNMVDTLGYGDLSHQPE
jgi:hypothetical protein